MFLSLLSIKMCIRDSDCCPDLKEGEICCIKVLAGCKSCHEQFEYTKQAVKAVSYTHLDVYKRQEYIHLTAISIALRQLTAQAAGSICMIFSAAIATFEKVSNCLSFVKKSKLVIISPKFYMRHYLMKQSC